MIPTDTFQVYVADMIRFELSKPDPISPNDLVRKLWDGAKFDYFMETQDPTPLLDDQGKPQEKAKLYASIIETARQVYSKGVKK